MQLLKISHKPVHLPLLVDNDQPRGGGGKRGVARFSNKSSIITLVAGHLLAKPSLASKGVPKGNLGTRKTTPIDSPILFLLIVLLIIAAPGWAAADPEFEIPRPGRVFRFPRDHGAHPQFKTEWWYYTGHLRSKEG